MGPVAPIRVVLAATALALARDAAALDLAEALARARVESPVVRAADAGVAAAHGRLAQAGVWATSPVVSTNLARHTGGGAEYIDREVALGQEVEVGGQRGLRTAAARHDLTRAEALLADALRGVEAEVRRAFAEVIAADRRRALTAERAALAARVVDAARRRAHAGEAATLDVRLAEIDAARAAHAAGTAEADRTRAAARLAAAVGLSPDEEVAAREDDAKVAPAPDERTAVTRALAARPDLAAARAERARLDGEAALVRRERIVPNPTLRGFYRQEFGDERIMGGEIAVPLPLWSRAAGTEAATRAAASGAAAEVERLERDIPRQVRVALARRAAASAAWDRYRAEALPAAHEADALVERAWSAGYLGLPEALVQQDRLRDARAAAIDAWLELRTADADLIEAVGGTPP